MGIDAQASHLQPIEPLPNDVIDRLVAFDSLHVRVFAGRIVDKPVKMQNLTLPTPEKPFIDNVSSYDH